MRILKSTREWPPLAIYDIEASEWTDVILVCHVDEWGNRRDFPNVEEYLDFLFSPDFAGEYVWAHFGGRYDHRFLIPVAYARGWGLQTHMSGGSIVILTLTDLTGRKIQFADSYRIMPNSLAAIGKTIKLEKMDVDRGAISRARYESDSAYREKVIEYCYRDCEIVLKGLSYMRDVLTSVGGDFAFTLASIASRWVRRSPCLDWQRFYKPRRGGKSLEYDPAMLFADYWCSGQDIPESAESPLSWSAYHGGRTEMFHCSTFEGTVKGPIYYYDVVSSYPASMTRVLPCYYQNFYPPPSRLTPDSIREFLSYYGVTEATVRVPGGIVPPIPFQQHNQPLIFPRGVFKGRFTNIELMSVLDRGGEVVPGWQCRFEGKAFLAPFVQTFYGLRKKAKADGDEFRTYAFKILLNSLYGKTVETMDRTSYLTDKEELEAIKALIAKLKIDPEDPKPKVKLESTAITGLYAVSTIEEGPFRHVAAGSYITAYSRLKLLEGIEEAERQGGRVLYCDTDSVMSTVPLPNIVGDELGQWQPEYILEDLEILLPKVYRARIAWHKDKKKIGEMVYKCKGMPIIRENEAPEIPELRWDAFKRFVESTSAKERHALNTLLRTGGVEALKRSALPGAEMASILARDGLSGFVADINAGSINPRRLPLLRAQQSHDKKRDWTASPSEPLTVSCEQDLPGNPFRLKLVR